jgi:hypothetical protein
MNIEISDKKYWKRLSYDDGLLYVSLLVIDGKDDWRLFKNGNERHRAGNHYNTSGMQEYLIPTMMDSDLTSVTGDDLWIIPVRDNIRLELCDRGYWKDMGYLDGLLYCSLLSIDGVGDWRMVERWEYEKHDMYYLSGLAVSEMWIVGDNDEEKGYYKWKKLIKRVIPVRDV